MGVAARGADAGARVADDAVKVEAAVDADPVKVDAAHAKVGAVRAKAEEAHARVDAVRVAVSHRVIPRRRQKKVPKVP